MPTAPVSTGPVTLCRVEIDGETWYRTLLAGILMCNTKNLADARTTYSRLTGGLLPSAIPTMKPLRRLPNTSLPRINGSPVDAAPVRAPAAPVDAAPIEQEKMVFKTPWGADFEV